MCESGSVFGIRIRIQEAPEYGSNTDPDPQHWLRSVLRIYFWSDRLRFAALEQSASPRKFLICSSVGVPNTLYLDPDPEICPNLDPNKCPFTTVTLSN